MSDMLFTALQLEQIHRATKNMMGAEWKANADPVKAVIRERMRREGATNVWQCLLPVLKKMYADKSDAIGLMIAAAYEVCSEDANEI